MLLFFLFIKLNTELFRNFTFSPAQDLEAMLSKHSRTGQATDGNAVQIKQRENTKRKQTNIRQVSKRQRLDNFYYSSRNLYLIFMNSPIQ